MLIDNTGNADAPVRSSIDDLPFTINGAYTYATCGRCHNLGLWLTPTGRIEVCPTIQIGDPHAEPNEASRLIERAARSLSHRGIVANPVAFSVAKAIARYSTDKPCPRQTLLNGYFSWARSQSLRELHSTVEELRSTWLLPVGSRKSTPHGYWIITDEADFRLWVDRARSAPIKQLTTIHAVAKANWPVFGEQLELEFWSDMGPTGSAGILPASGSVDSPDSPD